MGRDEYERECIALFVHGMLFLGHCLGVIHNLKRRNYRQALLHFGVACYDLWAVWEHYKELRRANPIHS